MKPILYAALIINSLLTLAAANSNANNHENAPRAIGRGGGGGGFGKGGARFGWGDNDCAISCASSYWQSLTPNPTPLCTSSPPLETCLSSCTLPTSALSSYHSRSSSLCSLFKSCSSTGTYTYTIHDRTSASSLTTYTGCPWPADSDGWGYGPWFGNSWGGPSFWDHIPDGWRVATKTETVTVTPTAGSGTITGAPVVSLVRVEEASSEDAKTTRTVALGEQASSNSGAAARVEDVLVRVKVVGGIVAALGVVAAML